MTDVGREVRLCKTLGPFFWAGTAEGAPMFEFLKRRKKPKAMAASGKTVEDMSLQEALASLKSEVDGDIKLRRLINYYRRLFTIAWFDHHISSEDRELADKMAKMIYRDVIASVAESPEAHNAFLEAVDYHEDQVPLTGFGSLHWIMEEHGITATELIPFAVQPEYAEILPVYLTMLETDVLDHVRYDFIRNLIRFRRETVDQSDVRIINELATKPDRAIEILLRQNELCIIRNMENDYGAAEALVARLVNS